MLAELDHVKRMITTQKIRLALLIFGLSSALFAQTASQSTPDQTNTQTPSQSTPDQSTDQTTTDQTAKDQSADQPATAPAPALARTRQC